VLELLTIARGYQKACVELSPHDNVNSNKSHVVTERILSELAFTFTP